MNWDREGEELKQIHNGRYRNDDADEERVNLNPWGGNDKETLFMSEPDSPPGTSASTPRRSPRRRRRGSVSAIAVPTADDLALDPGDPWAPWRITKENWKMLASIITLLFGGAYVLTQLLTLGTRFGHKGVQMNVILMIADGFGPTSEALGREFLQFIQESDANKAPAYFNASSWPDLERYYNSSLSLEQLASLRENKELPFFRDGVISSSGALLASLRRSGDTPLSEHHMGMSHTRSSNSLVTDSAAGATAFSCGVKTFNGAIGVEPMGMKPCGTLLEAAKRQGLSTGLVTTSRITHATPASFYAHVKDREMEAEIAPFLLGSSPLGRTVDVALGGGWCYFLPKDSHGSCRNDSRNLLEEAHAGGYLLLNSSADLAQWRTHEVALSDRYAEDQDNFGPKPHAPMLGLFSRGHMDYEIDRMHDAGDPQDQPALKDMAATALERLSDSSSKGFFLMIEGARIDMAAHTNDPSAHLMEILEYYETFDTVKKWALASDVPTLLISVADHETGGLTLGRQLDADEYPEYLWYPDVLLNATRSVESLGKQKVPAQDAFRLVGIQDASREELDTLEHASYTKGETSKGQHSPFMPSPFAKVLADAVSRRAQLGWTTHGHSGADVSVYALGPNSTGLSGSYDNTHISHHIAYMLGLSVELPTLELNARLDWFNPGGREPKQMLSHAVYHQGA